MKSFLGSTKGRIIAGVATLVVVGVIVAVFLLGNSGYRTIAVEELNGITKVANNGASSEAYVGQHFKKGDDVTVTEASDLTLSLDLDKYVYAKENTHFWIEASGKNADTRTTIHLDEGSVLCRIDNKLGDAGSFDIDTPNATMSVRGTVFKVECFSDDNGRTYTVVDVLEGQVYSQVKMEDGQNTEESRVLSAGESAIVHSDPSFSEFIKPENLEGFLKENSNIIGEIDFSRYSQNEAVFLGKAIEAGRELCISKELLFDIVGLTEHDFSIKGEEVAATCTEEGYYYEICSICGIESEKHIIDKLAHDYDADMVCKSCGKEEKQIKEEVAEEELQSDTTDVVTNTNEKADPCANGHTMVSNVVKATCVADGYEEKVCSVCGYKGERTELKATGHNYVITRQEPTCDVDGLQYHTCSNCGDMWADVIPAVGHDWNHSHADASCMSEGFDSDSCSRCGAGTYKAIPATGHSASGGYSYDGSGHWQSCGKCGIQMNKSGHSPDPTGHCSVCGWG